MSEGVGGSFRAEVGGWTKKDKGPKDEEAHAQFVGHYMLKQPCYRVLKSLTTSTVSTFHHNVAPDQDQQNVCAKESGGKSVYLQLSSFVSLPRMISLVIDQYPSTVCGRFVWALCE